MPLKSENELKYIADRMRAIDSSGIRKVFDLGAKLTNPINLSIGQPDFDVPLSIREAMKCAIDSGGNRYTLTQGIEQLRKNIIEQNYNGRYDLENIVITSGVSGGLTLALWATLNPGDEAIMVDPYFVMYPALTRLMGGVPVFADIAPEYVVTREALEKAYTPKAKLLLVNSPANPTGITLSREEVITIAEFAKARDLLVISDEIYDAFVYDVPFVSVSDYYENTLVLNGYSKNFAMTGHRVGYAAGPKDIIREMIKVQQYTFVCAPSAAQIALAENLETDLRPVCEAYKKKRDIIYDGLIDAFDFVKPTGAFYALLRMKDGSNGSAFVERAIANNILVIPSNVFSRHDNGFRLSFAANDETLKRGAEALSALAKTAS